MRPTVALSFYSKGINEEETETLGNINNVHPHLKALIWGGQEIPAFVQP